MIKSQTIPMAQALATAPPIAAIDEEACIGCTLCIEACPVDAIVGAARLMHTVIAAECTGCRRCIPPCPVDCITMAATGDTWTHEERAARAAQYRRRYDARRTRLERLARLDAERARITELSKEETIARVTERARLRRTSREP
jgi:Na+-translocating ferredoxin:NAD+ oxidoreductase subunit B